MGIFKEWAWQYAEHGISTFPVHIEGKDKRPAIKGYMNVGLTGSERLAEADRFRHLDSFGIPLKKNKLAVLDVDTPDERVLIEAFDRFGQSPFVVRTHSGNWQAYYRHNGETRQIRPDNDGERPIDILGDGYAVAAPSRGADGRYEIVQGNLATLSDLPQMRPQQATIGYSDGAGAGVGQGSRWATLRTFLMHQAQECKTAGELISTARTYVMENFDTTTGHAFTDGELLKLAHDIWQMTQEGRNFAGRGRSVVTSHETLDRVMSLGPDALFLFQHLQKHNWRNEPFPIANVMRETMPGGEWALRRLQNARAALLSGGILEQVRHAVTGEASLFRWL